MTRRNFYILIGTFLIGVVGVVVMAVLFQVA